jgi:2-furoyl-CoA dehydrogenase large subunit
MYPSMALMALASRQLGVPVKWIEDRNEHLVASTAAGQRLTEMEGAFDESGVLLALRIKQLENLGAYIRAPEPAALYRMHSTASGPYKVRHIAIENRAVVTNQVPTGLNRGFGGPQFVYPLERLMDKAARKFGIDTIEMRRRNLVDASAMPYEGPAGSVLDSGDYHAAVVEVARIAGLDELKRRQDDARKAGRKFGIGIACSVETSASNMAYVNLAMSAEQRARSLPKSGAHASAYLTMDATGQVTVHIDSTPAGQGHRTVAGQIVADAMGVKPEDVDVVTALDTQAGPWSITSGNYANRFSTTVASAIALAARQSADKLKLVAAAALGVTPAQVVLAGGKASAPGGRNEPIPIRRLAAQLHWNAAGTPDGVDLIAETAMFSPRFLKPGDDNDVLRSSLTYTFQVDLAAVEIDPATSTAHVVRYASVHDVGNQLNPALVEGQALGGFVHGLGAALYERLAYRSDGTPIAQTFQDYLVPTAPEAPRPVLGHVSSPSPYTLHGSKGLGDGCTMTVPAAIGNAVADALGREEIAPPFTPARILAYADDGDADWALRAPPARSKTARAWMLSGAGSTEIAAPVDVVWQAMLDPERLSKAIPGCRDLVRTGEDRYTASVRLSVAGIGTTVAAAIALVDPEPPKRVTLKGEASSDLGDGEGEALVTLTPTASGGTRLDYEWGGDLSGKAAAIGHRMLAGVMSRVVAQIFDRLGADITGQRPRSMLGEMIEFLFGLIGRKSAR